MQVCISESIVKTQKNNEKPVQTNSQSNNQKNNQLQIYLRVGNQNNPLYYDTIKKYLQNICIKMKVDHLNLDLVANSVYSKLKTVNTTDDVDEQIVLTATELITKHYDYPSIATCILINKLHQNTHDDYSKVVEQLYRNVNKKGNHAPIVNEGFYHYVKKNSDQINSAFKYERDYETSVFGYRTLEKAYLKKDPKGKIIERPQHLYMRVAIALHYRDDRMDRIIETYELLSSGYFIHATPTLFNAGTTHEQLSSCFLLNIEDDMAGIGDCWKECALISKYSGGIGIHATNIRVDGAYINSTQGRASGLRVLKVLNEIARYADQGGKRAGSIAVYIEPWHGDIMFFLDLKKNTGAETERARDLFLALMVNDIFMERVKSDGMWSLMCPSECPNLLDKYGVEFTQIYEKYESEGKYLKQMKARELWFKIMETQIETGVPYIVFKDAVNNKSNQINIGVINGSNLCAEIVEYSDKNETAVCNLASVCLPKFIKYNKYKPTYDYDELYRIVRIITRNLNNIIKINFYPNEKTKRSNLKNSPIGIGQQGLADLFAIFRIPFDSTEARVINKNIAETIYFAALTESMNIAKERGYPYETYHGSPLSKGQFQFNLWGINEDQLSGLWDWKGLREMIKIYGVANSLTTTAMPTASSSQIRGWNECIEPFTENIYTRSTLAGDYYVVNKYLMKELMDLGLWSDDIIDSIKYFDGSIAQIEIIPDEIKKIYRTAWEIDQMSIIEMAADRGPFIDQTQSMNLFIATPSFARLNTCLFHAWNLGLKTGIYYLRSKAVSAANKFGIDVEKMKELELLKAKNPGKKICQYVPKNLRKPGDCDSCSS